MSNAQEAALAAAQQVCGLKHAYELGNRRQSTNVVDMRDSDPFVEVPSTDESDRARRRWHVQNFLEGDTQRTGAVNKFVDNNLSNPFEEVAPKPDANIASAVKPLEHKYYTPPGVTQTKVDTADLKRQLDAALKKAQPPKPTTPPPELPPPVPASQQPQPLPTSKAASAPFQPDYTPEQLENLGVYDALYRGQGPRLASLGEWKPEWISEHDPKGWAQWYKRYASGRRIEGEDERQIKRWVSFKARHGGPFIKNPTPRRGWALRNWGIDPSKLVDKEQSQTVTEMLDAYQQKAMQKYVQDRIKASAELAVGKAECQIGNLVKQAAPAWVKMLRAGRLSPANLVKVTSSLPVGTTRYVRHLGKGGFNVADLMAGNVGGQSGLLVRKLPTHRGDMLAAADHAHQASQILDKKFPGVTARYLDRGNARGIFQEYGDKVGVPNWQNRWRSNADYNMSAQQMKEVYAPLSAAGVKDIKNVNLGPRGQLIDFQYRLPNGYLVGGNLPGATIGKLSHPATITRESQFNLTKLLGNYALRPAHVEIPKVYRTKLFPQTVLRRLNDSYNAARGQRAAYRDARDALLARNGVGSRLELDAVRKYWLGRRASFPESHAPVVITPTTAELNSVARPAWWRSIANFFKRSADEKQADLLPGIQQKEAASALRRLLKITAQPMKTPADDLAVAWGPAATKWVAQLGNRDIGHIITTSAGSTANPAAHKILYSHLQPQFHGLGLGRKLYMDVARRVGGELMSDTKVSPAAQRVWQSMQRRNYGVNRSPAAVPARGIQLPQPVYELPAYPRLAVPGSPLNMWDKVRSFFQRIAAPDADALNYIYRMKLPARIPHIKQADLLPGIQLQPHQQRIADRVTGDSPRMLVYHGLGSGKSLSALAAAEAARKIHGGNYGIVAPASLRDNFKKEIKKFTRNSNPEVMSYTGLGMGKQFQEPPGTLIMDEAARLRNPGSASTQAAARAAQQASRLLLLTGTPITNEPKDLASLLSLIHNKPISPEEFDKQFVGEERVSPGWLGWLRGIKPGSRPIIRNGPKLRALLEGHVDYQPSKTPEGVNVNEQIVRVPLSPEQQKIQKAIRTKIPPGFLWKLDREFPLSRDELAKLNSFLTGLRQVSLSTQPFRADKNPLKAFQQSAKMQTAFKNLREVLDSDPRKKAIIYSNFVDAGLAPYAAGLEDAGIPHALFHGGVSTTARQAAVDAYNANKLRALLIGPAGAEGLSTKGTSLIQLMDPHWNEARSQQAKGRGLRFDSHRDLPEELKNVAVQKYISSSEDPSWLGKWLGYQRQRTGDEVLEHLTADKERLNEEFRKILREVGAKK